MADLPEWIGAAPSEADAAEAKAYAGRKLSEVQRGGRFSAREKALAFAARRETTTRSEIARLEHLLEEHIESFPAPAPSAAGKEAQGRWEAEAQEILARVRVQAEDLVRALRDQGRLDEAQEIARRYVPAEAVRLEAGRAALLRADDERCSCPPFEFEEEVGGQTKRLSSPNYQLVKELWSAHHGAWVYLLRCLHCADLNITPLLPPDVERLEGARAHPEWRGAGAGADRSVLRRG
jgi:hypothetical protein